MITTVEAVVIGFLAQLRRLGRQVTFLPLAPFKAGALFLVRCDSYIDI